jgi:hypothetical protein
LCFLWRAGSRLSRPGPFAFSLVVAVAVLVLDLVDERPDGVLDDHVHGGTVDDLTVAREVERPERRVLPCPLE